MLTERLIPKVHHSKQVLSIMFNVAVSNLECLAFVKSVVVKKS